MKKQHYLILCITLSMCFIGCQKDVETLEESSELKLSHEQDEKPIQHLKLEDIATESSAVEVMQSTTEQLRAKTNLDALELHEIHMITYSLEKAVAFFAEKDRDGEYAGLRRIGDPSDGTAVWTLLTDPEEVKAMVRWQLEDQGKRVTDQDVDSLVETIETNGDGKVELGSLGKF